MENLNSLNVDIYLFIDHIYRYRIEVVQKAIGLNRNIRS